MTRADIDWLVPHQANMRIIQATARKLDLPMEQVVVTVDRTATPRRPRCRWPSMRPCAMAASNAARPC
jgi:hypothetical protein